MVISFGIRMAHFLSSDAVHLLVTVYGNVVNEAMLASIYILLPYLHEAFKFIHHVNNHDTQNAEALRLIK